jgi:hypothetical protein
VRVGTGGGASLSISCTPACAAGEPSKFERSSAEFTRDSVRPKGEAAPDGGPRGECTAS